MTEVTSTDNSDLSEKEFLDNQTTDDGITPAPKDFTEVSPESIGVRVKLDAALDFLKGLKGQDLEVSLSSLTVSCDALRAGEQTINISVDPDRAAALIAKSKSSPGVVAAGWTSGVVEMDRTIRFAAADWRDGDKLNRDKIAAAIAGVLAKTLSAKPAAAAWDANTGKLKLTFKRPSQIFPALGLTETIEVTALVAPDKPGASDRLMLWIGSPVISTADESAGPRLNLTEEIQRRRGRRPEGRQRLGRCAGQGIQGPALGRGQIGLEIDRIGRRVQTHPHHAFTHLTCRIIAAMNGCSWLSGFRV